MFLIILFNKKNFKKFLQEMREYENITKNFSLKENYSKNISSYLNIDLEKMQKILLKYNQINNFFLNLLIMFKKKKISKYSDKTNICLADHNLFIVNF